MSTPSHKGLKKGLGRGFESLIPTDLLDESFDPTASQDQQVSELRNIKIDQIVIDPDQPRKHFDQEGLDELANSISEHGVLQPIIVVPHGNGYQIVAGERRFRASTLAGLNKIPALVRTLTDQHKLEISLIENLQRKDLNIMETATAYLKLRDQFNMTLEQIGKRVGNRSVSAVSNTLRLLKLPDNVRQALVEGLIHEGHARPLIGLDEATINDVLPKIIKEGWSTRRVEQFIVALSTGEKSAPSLKKTSEQYEPQLERIKTRLKTDVSIRSNAKGGGQITIKFKDKKEFERIQDILG